MKNYAVHVCAEAIGCTWIVAEVGKTLKAEARIAQVYGASWEEGSWFMTQGEMARHQSQNSC